MLAALALLIQATPVYAHPDPPIAIVRFVPGSTRMTHDGDARLATYAQVLLNGFNGWGITYICARRAPSQPRRLTASRALAVRAILRQAGVRNVVMQDRATCGRMGRDEPVVMLTMGPGTT
jgi:hypothetical protein